MLHCSMQKYSKMKGGSMKGIILAVGSNHLFYPMDKVAPKYLLPVYDKPMIYYPLATLMVAGIRDVLVICTPENGSTIAQVLSNGDQLGMRISYATIDKPMGIGKILLSADSFIKGQCVTLILGDSIYIGKSIFSSLPSYVQKIEKDGGSLIIGSTENQPHNCGVIELDAEGKIKTIDLKPVSTNQKSNICMTGLFFFDNSVIEYSKRTLHSNQDEYEIIDLERQYLNDKKLNWVMLDNDSSWINISDFSSMNEISNIIQELQIRHAKTIACIEEIAFLNGWISKSELSSLCPSVYDGHDTSIFQNHVKSQKINMYHLSILEPL